jgi:hypothetical protein
MADWDLVAVPEQWEPELEDDAERQAQWAALSDSTKRLCIRGLAAAPAPEDIVPRVATAEGALKLIRLADVKALIEHDPVRKGKVATLEAGLVAAPNSVYTYQSVYKLFGVDPSSNPAGTPLRGECTFGVVIGARRPERCDGGLAQAGRGRALRRGGRGRTLSGPTEALTARER